MVVDDDRLIGLALRRFLRTHTVAVFTRAELALERIERGERYDAILCDLLMPGMTGIDLHAALVAAVPEQASRMIFMSATADDAQLKALLDRIPNACLEKPLDVERLRDLLRNLKATSL